jgi:gamma-D-glutamyl-L-lysine dipeptidyl-peptidase
MLCLLVALLMAEGVTAASATAVISAPVANMYSRADANADVVSQAIYGSDVQIVGRRGGWVRIRTADSYTGWVVAASVLRHPPYAQAWVQVESLFANVYREADVTKHRPLLTLPFEARLEVLPARQPVRAEDPRWLRVRLPGGRRAWIQRGDVTADPKPRTVAEVIEFSRRFLGLPYLWGGTSTYGYDCSGFTQMLCRRRGLVIPRDASQQAAWTGAVPVTRGQLRPGDLLYFGASADKITHTGMYIGNGEFIDATPWERPVVQIDRLDDPHWALLFVAARRIP